MPPTRAASSAGTPAETTRTAAASSRLTRTSWCLQPEKRCKMADPTSTVGHDIAQDELKADTR